MKFIYLFLFFGVISTSVFAQNLEITGVVVDSISSEPLKNATVSLDFKRKSLSLKTDDKGRFKVFLTKEDHAISVRYVGYVPFWLYTDANSVSTNYVIKMRQVVNELEQVVVSTNRIDENVKKPLLGVNQINIKTLEKIPSAFGEVDFLRGIQMLPGVSSVGEASNGVNIRGGTTDQNLILIDDTPIYNPTHMFGLFSVIPPDAISNLDLYKGNVPARYGGRAASVLDLTLKNPNLSSIKIKGGISIVSNKLMVEVPVIKDRVGIYFAGRGAFTDFLLPRLSPQLENVKTNFYEGVLKGFWRVNNKNTLTLMRYGSNDFFQTDLLSNLPNVIGSATFFEHKTTNYNAKWVYLINNNLDLSTSFTRANYDPTIGTIENLTNYKVKLNSGLDQSIYKSSLNYQKDKQKVEMGLNFTQTKIRPGTLDPGKASGVNYIEVPTEYSNEYGIFIDDEYEFSKKLAVTAGLRYSFFTALGASEVRTYDAEQPRDEFSVTGSTFYNKGEIIKTYGGLEPRFGLRYLLNETVSLKMGYNLMRQYLQIVSNTTTPIPTSRWKTSDANIAPQVSHLFTLGSYKTLEGNVYDISIEGYYRRSNNIIDYKPGADFLLQKFPETQLVQGFSTSYGAEIMFSKKKGNLTGWTNYTYARTFNQVYANTNVLDLVNNGNSYRANYDRPHTFNTSIDIAVDKHNSFAFNFVLSSGRPYSKPVGFVNYQNNFYPFYDERNNARIPTYHRLDFSWNITNPSMKDRRYKGNWAFSVYNLYAHKNAYSVYFKTENGSIKAYKLQIFGAPIVSLAYNFKFE
ncbi:TonB-dependent receptor [Lacihabitans sp. LS3-19]|nr:TonB-dependent receptor [Lacihabitans sp. LS3-19]